METNTARNFALQLGALASLYVSLVALIMLLFGCVTLSIPDATDSSWQLEGAAERVRLAFAIIVIFFPTYLVLTRRVNFIRRHEQGAYLTLTKWLIYLSLLVGGAVLLGDAVAIIYSFLEGETTTRFLLKASLLAGVIASAFFYYLLDARGYWQAHEQHSLFYGAAASLVAVAALLWGFTNIESPAEVREMRLDEQQISDLADIQFRIGEHLRTQEELPNSIDELYNVEPTPTAPGERAPYRYNQIETGFELCAEFGADSKRTDDRYPRVPTLFNQDVAYPVIKNPNEWEYKAGEWCFERSVNSDSVSTVIQ